MGVLWHPKNKGVVRFQSRFEVSLDVLYSPPPLQDGSMSLPPPPPTSLLNMVTISCPSLLWRVFISCKLLQNITFQRKEASINYIYFIRLIFSFAARNRGIAIPADLESQIQALFTRSQLVMKHTRHWLSHGKGRRDSIMNLSRDYRSIIEGLQVRVLYLCYLPTPERKRATEVTAHERHLIT